MSSTILYIEDNQDNVEIVEKILEQAGYTVYIAEEGVAGIAMAEKHRPDVIICDYHLPGMNGVEIMIALRKKTDLKHIPLIMLTADIYTQEESLAAGVDKYLNKPIRRNQLLSTVANLLQ